VNKKKQKNFVYFGPMLVSPPMAQHNKSYAPLFSKSGFFFPCRIVAVFSGTGRDAGAARPASA
jgi:hypothetical protein